MAIHLDDPGRPELGAAGWRAPPRCCTRAARPEAIAASPAGADGNAHVLAFRIALIALRCVAALLLLEHGGSF